ncbi:MAG: amidohydrolase family protein [archaeon]|nr:amidohydrolase family protein [archaeon]
MEKILVTGDFVATMDRKRRVLREAAVYIEGDTIVDVGSSSELKSKYSPDLIVGGKKRLILPGFVNTHDHYEETLMRQSGDNRDLTSWVEQIINPCLTELNLSDISIGVKICVAEQLKSGITTVFNDTVSWLPRKLNKREVIEVIGKAAEEVGGVRLVQAIGGMDHEDLRERAELYHYDIQLAKDDCVNLIQKFNRPGSMTKIWTAATTAVFCTPEMYRTMKDVADQYHTGTYSHIAETIGETGVIKARTGKTEVQYFDSLGFLDEHTLLAHAIWIDETDIDRLKARSSKVTHQPICNCYLSDGVAPVPLMLRKGITVGLGMDDGGHTNEDYFNLMRMFTLIHKGVTTDPSSSSAEKALEMGTIDGARAIGMEDSIGSLEPGKKADITVINLERLTYAPHLRPIMALVYAGMESDVEMTILNGKIVVENGKLTSNVVESKLLAEAERAAAELVKRAGLKIKDESHLGWQYL